MNHALLMSRVQSASNLAEDLRHALERHPAFFADHFFERTSAQIFHYDIDDSILVLAEVGHAKGMWVRDARGGSGFSGKSRNDFLVRRERRAKDLYRHGLIHQNMSTAIDGAHATFI
jgi:hypothetical protein